VSCHSWGAYGRTTEDLILLGYDTYRGSRRFEGSRFPLFYRVSTALRLKMKAQAPAKCQRMPSPNDATSHRRRLQISYLVLIKYKPFLWQGSDFHNNRLVQYFVVIFWESGNIENHILVRGGSSISFSILHSRIPQYGLSGRFSVWGYHGPLYRNMCGICLIITHFRVNSFTFPNCIHLLTVGTVKYVRVDL